MKKNLLTSLKELLKALGGEKSDKTNIVGVVDEITEQVKNGGNNDKNGGTLYVKIKTEPYTNPETGEEEERNVVYTDPETGNEYDVLDKTYTEVMEAKNNGKTIIIEYNKPVLYICYPIRYSESGIWAISTERGCPETPIEFNFRRTDSDLLYCFFETAEGTGPQQSCAFAIRSTFVATCYAVSEYELEINVTSPELVRKGYDYGIYFIARAETDAETGDQRVYVRCLDDNIKEEDRGLAAALSILLYRKLAYEEEYPRIELPSHWDNSYKQFNVPLCRYLLDHYNEFTFYL